MIKNLTNRMFSVIALMMLMMATALSASATAYLAGSMTDWANGKVAMTQDANGNWTITRAFSDGDQFKIMEDDTWYGAPAEGETWWVTPSSSAIQLGEGNKNLEIKATGTFKISYNATSKQVVVNYPPQPVTVAAGIVNGTVTVDKSEASAGEVITVTVTPAAGYYAEKGDVKAEKTIGSGQAQTPGTKAAGPGVGTFVTVDGDETDDVSQARTYTITMPESPYGVQVSATFTQRMTITKADDIADQAYDGTAKTPATVVYYNNDVLTAGTDYTITYKDNINVGTATATITGKGKYTGTITKNFNIVYGTHSITITTDGNGTVTANTQAAAKGDEIVLTITPNDYYILDKLTVDGVEVTVTGNTYTFTMPDANVTVNATFKLKPRWFIMGTVPGSNWDNGLEMTDNGDGTFSITINGVENGNLFKFKDQNGTWYGPNSGTENWNVHKDWSTEIPLTESSLEINYNIQGGGNLTFTVDTNKNLIIVTGWETKVYLFGDDDDWAAGAEMTLKDGKYTITKTTTGAYAFKFADNANNWYGGVVEDGSEHYFDITRELLGQELSTATTGNNFYLPYAGEWTFTFDLENLKTVVTGTWPVYNITVEEAEGGSVKATVDGEEITEALVGTEVTFTVTPEAGYDFTSLTVNGQTVEATANEDGTYTYVYTMTAADVTVVPVFTEKTPAMYIYFNGESQQMTKNESDDSYTITINGVKAGDTFKFFNQKNEWFLGKDANGNYGVHRLWSSDIELVKDATENNFEVTKGKGNLTFTIKDGKLTITGWDYTLSIMGQLDGATEWTTTEMTLENGWWTTKQTFANKGEFIFVDNDGNYFKGNADGDAFWFTDETIGQEIDLTGESGKNFLIENSGEWTIMVNDATTKVKVLGDWMYSITVNNPEEGGSVVADKAASAKDATITLTVTVEKGYDLDKLTVMNGETEVATTKNEDGTYSFTMPAANVVVSVSFTKRAEAFYILTSANEWARQAMTLNNDGSYSITIENVANGTEFKFQDQTDDWFGGNGNGSAYEVKKDWYSDIELVTPGDNFKVVAAAPVTLTFTVKDGKLTVTGWDYNVNIAEGIENGTVVATPATAKAGAEVALTVTPAEGYELTELKVMNGENEVEVTDDYKFTMPTADVTVYATFTKTPKLYLTGSFNEWAQPGVAFTHNEDGTWTLTQAMPAHGEFKLINEDGAWIGGEADEDTFHWITETMLGQAQDLVYGDEGKNFYIHVAGTWTLTVNADRTNVTVTGDWNNPEFDVNVEGNDYVTVTADKEKATEGETVTITVTSNDDFTAGTVTVLNGDDEVEVTDNGDGTYSFAMPEGNVSVEVTVKAKLQGVAFTAERAWSTYYGAYNLALPQGVKAYVVDQVLGNATVITEISYIPAGVGVLLYSETAGENLLADLYTGTTGTYTSLLEGDVKEMAISAGYVLYNGTFVRTEAGTLAAHRCYLPGQNVAGAPALLKIGYEGAPTAIQNILASGNVAKVTYVNLQGVQSETPFRGVNIVVVTMNDGTTQTVKILQ